MCQQTCCKANVSDRFPYTTAITVAEINYAPIIVAGVALLGAIYYVLYARKNYQNPAPDEIGNGEV